MVMSSAGAEVSNGSVEIKRPAARQHDTTPRLDLTLENAEYLLNYAVEAGIEVDPELAQSIVSARRGGSAVWDGLGAGALIASISKLAAKVHPVTGETLRACQDKARAQIRRYTWIAVGLAALIVPLSMISFITTGISNSITADLRTANDLAVTLHSQLDTPAPSRDRPAAQLAAPAASLPDLQQFATMIRSVKDHTMQLDTFLLNRTQSPLASADYREYELNPGLENSLEALQKETASKTYTYQKVRLYAKEVQDDVAIFYGSISACLLPMLYALLGACAYLLRLFSDELNSRTFSPSYAISARFFIALIGGMIVGLFSNFTQGASLPPLAIAFLVGYAADVFFSFLEGLMQSFKRPKPA